MDNYKITNTEEAISLLDELGYDVTGLNDRSSFLYAKAQDKNVFNGVVHPEDYESITVEKLRDLVVLKRNDVKDATHFDPEDGLKYIDLSGKWHWFNEEVTDEFPKLGWHESANTREYDDRGLKPLNQNPALISGADAELVEQAKRFITSDHLDRFQAAQAHLEGKAVQFMLSNGAFFDITDDSTVGIFGSEGGYSFRLKPQTFKLELELPKPFEPKEGDSFYFLSDGEECGFVKCEHDWTFDPKELNFGAYRTEDEIKQVVEQLRKIRGAS